MEQITLYATVLDETKAMVSDSNSIFYNLGKIDNETLQNMTTTLGQYDNGTSIIPAGRYVCITTMSLDTGAAGQILLDHKDKNIILRSLNSFTNDAIKDKIKKSVEFIIAHPEDHNKFKVVEGVAPVENK